MKYYLGVVFWLNTLFLSISLFAQTSSLNTQWIKPNQTYYRVEIFEQGVYRLTYGDLKAAGFAVDATLSHEYEMYWRGEEVDIFIHGVNGSGVLQPEGYIEFYGQRPDGEAEKDLFKRGGWNGVDNPRDLWRLNPYENMHDSPSVYFLTASINFNNSRVPEIIDEDFSGLSSDIKLSRKKLISVKENGKKGFFKGLPVDGRYIYRSNFYGARGFTASNTLEKNLYNFPLEGIDVSGRDILMEYGLVNTSTQSIEAQLGINENISKTEQIVGGRGVKGNWSFSPQENIINENLSVTLTNAINTKSVLFTYWLIDYPYDKHKVNATLTTELELEALTERSLMNIQGATRETVVWDISDRLHPKKLVMDDAFQRVVIPANTSRVFIGEAAKRAVSIAEANFFFPEEGHDYDYLLVTHQLFMQSSNGDDDVIKRLKDYKESELGGAHKVYVADVTTLYNTYFWGETTPWAIREFANAMLESGDPRFLFLVGKGLRLSDTELGTIRNYVPPYGFPASDNLYTAGLDGKPENVPALATGRLCAQTAEQIDNYLSKIKEFDNQGFNSLWRKQALYLSGGGTSLEKESFRRYVDSYKANFESSAMGGEGKTLSKVSTQATELIDVVEEVNGGLGMLTFFGHSSNDGSDVTIGFVSAYDRYNKGVLERRTYNVLSGYANRNKYPFVLMNGCNGGDCFLGGNYSLTNKESWGENWLLTRNKGAIMFLAKLGYGYPDKLNYYSSKLNENLFLHEENYGKSVGEVIQKTVEELVAANPLSRELIHIEQMVFQGDPSLSITPVKADYAVKNGEVELLSVNENEAVSAQSDSVKLSFPLYNYGKYGHTDSVDVTIRRTFIDGTTFEKNFRIKSPAFKETVSVVLDNSIYKDKAGGENVFEVWIDKENSVEEYSIINNYVKASFLLSSNVLKLVSPAQFSIYGKDLLSVYGYDMSADTEERYFVAEVDTSPSFNSAIKMTKEVFARQLPKWEFDLPVKEDGTVYYIRIGYRDLRPDDVTKWDEGSFTYIKDKAGWMQSQIPQFSKNSRVLFDLNTQSQWKFINKETEIEVVTRGKEAGLPSEPYTIRVNGDVAMSRGGCGEDMLFFMTFDGETGDVYVHDRTHGIVCGSVLRNGVRQNPDWLAIRNGIPNDYLRNEGDYILMVGYNGDEGIQYSRFRDLIKTKDGYVDGELQGLEKMGMPDPAYFMSRIKDGDPYIMLARKGFPQETIEIYPEDVGNTNIQQLRHTFNISSNLDYGYMVSDVIGKASSWGTITLDVDNFEPDTDSYQLGVYGVMQNGDTTLIEEYNASTLQSSGHIIDISSTASMYSSIRLKYYSSDPINNTPPRLVSWKVDYQPKPEGVLYMTEEMVEHLNDKYYQGEDIYAEYWFENISSTSFATESQDSLDVIVNIPRAKSPLINQKIPAVDAGEKTKVTFSASSWDLGVLGKQTLLLTANEPEKELYFFNNSQQYSFEVDEDKQNPLLDVLFDGRRILDGDKVSPEVELTISLKDDNPYLVRETPENITVFLNGNKIDLKNISVLEQDNLSGNHYTVSCLLPEAFQEANEINEEPESGLRTASDILTAEGRLQDGVYTLKVEAQDIAGNNVGAGEVTAGDDPTSGERESYKVTFEVDSKPSITHFYPYPNPFSDKVRFVFTLTGVDVPDQLKIQIMTVTGRVVREITQDEIGPLHIGNNITEYAWDGRDEFGDQLANGVYLYRVIVLNQGNAIEHAETKGDSMFKQGIGKLYLMR